LIHCIIWINRSKFTDTAPFPPPRVLLARHSTWISRQSGRLENLTPQAAQLVDSLHYLDQSFEVHRYRPLSPTARFAGATLN
jgi:hypothetical protein